MEKNEKVSIKYDAFVKAVRPDPKSTENTVYLEGFIGESSVSNHFRLYSDASLNDFVEIPTDAVIHSIAHSKEESPLGGSKLWVKQDAIYTYGNPAMANRPQGSFFEGDLYQGYMDSMYQPDASGAGMGAMGGGISQPIAGCVSPIPQTIISKPIICKKSLLTPCVTKPFSPICNNLTRPIVCQITKTIVGCPQITTTVGPIKSIADCPSFPCPTPTFRTETINPNPFGGTGAMADPSGGSFNPYFDGDLYQGYMDSMYQPDANTQSGDAGAMGGGMENMAPTALCGTGVVSISCPIRTIVNGCVEPSRFIICNRVSQIFPCFSQPHLGCITRKNDSRCCVIKPTTWRTITHPTTTIITTITTTHPTTTRIDTILDTRIINRGGGQQFGGDFYGSFDPYSGY